ncbi:MAG TPA: hypothetical protein VFX59_30985 [Polyangiales bacterium]|nr:hypothetical protein [Polyangiales bacterium]
MGATRMGLGRRGVVLFALGCLGCDPPPGGDSARGLQEGIIRGDGGPVLISRDAGLDTLPTQPPRDAGGLTSRPPAQDAGEAVDAALPGDAGQDAGVAADAGELALDPDGGSIEPNPSSTNPTCRTLFYRDLDGDGFGDPKASVISCTRPPGYVLAAGDCYDANDRARPGATGQFLTQRGDGSFDYDCDGLETRARTTFAVCPKVEGACPPEAIGCHDDALRISWDAAEDAGWTDFRVVPCIGSLCPLDKTKIPACGQAGYWGLSVAWEILGARYACTVPVAGTTRIQTCR